MAAKTDFEKWLDSFPEERMLQQQREYATLAEEYSRRANEIAHLITLRRRLTTQASLNEVLRELRELPPPGEDETVRLFPPEGAAGRPSLADGVLTVVGKADRPVSAQEILDALNENGWGPRGKTPINSVHATTSRLTRAGRLRRIKGRFRLAEGEMG